MDTDPISIPNDLGADTMSSINDAPFSLASDLFHEYHDILAKKANSYFDSVLKVYQAKGHKE